MNYCISDPHGAMALFQTLLQTINFSDEDHLYILGDVIDRGDDGIALLKMIMDHPKNMTVLLGNHEALFLRALNDGASTENIDQWDRNYNRKTMQDYFALSRKEQLDILYFIRSLPSFLDIEVVGRKYHLVHGWPGNTIRERAWGRPSSIYLPNPFENRTLIVGHTPVVLLHCKNDTEQNEFFYRLDASGGHMRILHAPDGWIDLDCGCSYPVPGAALGCMRLEDGAEFYIRADGR